MSATVAALDPRMRARRVAVLRAEGRRRLRVLTAFACILLAGAGAWGISRSPLLDVDRIAVGGADAVRDAEVLRSSQLATGLPMLFLDIDEAERSISALPWVKSARVRRDWPATVRVHVTPRVPAAVVPTDGGRVALIDANGHVTGWATSSTIIGGSAGLPHVSVPFDGQLGAVHVDADGALAAAAALPGDLRAWVKTVAVDPANREISLELNGGATAVLGEPILLDDKMNAVRTVLAGTELICIVTIDVTMPDIATVDRHRSCRT